MHPLHIYLAFCIILCLFICTYAWQSRIRGSKFFAFSCLLAVFWTLAELVKRVFPDYSLEFIAENIRFIAVILMPPSLFVFTLQYCRRELTLKKIFLIFLIPIISIIVFLTSRFHLLFYKSTYISQDGLLRLEYGYYYWFVHLPFSYLLISGCLAVLYISIRNVVERDRRQLIILFFSIWIPFISNVLSAFNIIGGLPLTVLSFPIFFSIIALSIFRYDFLQSSPIPYEKVFHSIHDGVVVVDNANVILDVNPAAAKTLGKSKDEIVGKDFDEVFSKWKGIIEKYRSVTNFYDEVSVEIKGERKFISVTIVPILDKSHRHLGKIFIFRDITEHKHYEFFLRNLAFRDALTHIANRRKFQEDFENLVEKSKDSQKSFAIIYFDLNDFKQVNDNYGHDIGDELLKLIAARTASVLRGPDLVARFGGDEFAVLLHDCDKQGAQIAAERMIETVSEPFKVEDHELRVGISLGIAVYPHDGTSLPELLRKADRMLIAEKKRRKTRVAKSKNQNE